MIVNSIQLEKAAAAIRDGTNPTRRIRAGGYNEDVWVVVSAEQLDTAARILREAEPSVITHMNGRRLIEPQKSERPGFIEKDRQLDSEMLTLNVGIIPMHTFHINREGKVMEWANPPGP